MPQPLCDGVGVGLISLTVAHDFDVKQFFGIFWSLVPYAFLAVLIIGLFLTQRMSLFVLVVFGLIMTAINEFAIKHVHEENRPERSCLDSGGFPSGHAMISTLYLTWITIEIFVHPNWTWRKRLAVLIPLWCLLAPCPPFRHVGGDHSWNQIAAGVVIGFILGLIGFLLTQFLVVRYLDIIMGWRITKFLRLQNDLRPQYQQSADKGAKAPAHTPAAFPAKQRIHSMQVYNAAHILPIALNYILGALGIILGSVKKHQSSCNRSSGPVDIGVGLWTFIAAMIMTLVYILSLRKKDKKSWYPELLQGLVFTAGLFLFEAFFWNVAGVSTSREDDGCYHRNLTYVYSIVWFALECLAAFYMSLFYVLLDVRRTYGFKKNCVAHPNGKVQTSEGAADEKGIPEAEKATQMTEVSPTAA